MSNNYFTLRKDQNGFRPVFLLGNNRAGGCPYKCRFCYVGSSQESITPQENIRKFDKLYNEYIEQIDGPYHPVIYNRGNVTNQEEFSRETLDYILGKFNEDKRVSYVSINSREKEATADVLDYLANKDLSFSVHFILGLESFSDNLEKVIGKKTNGELDRFIEKLRNYNQKHDSTNSTKQYIFGLDVNLLFLPELYLNEGDIRENNYSKIKEGIKKDLKELLSRINPNVPMEINIHPYQQQIESFPHEDANLSFLINLLPELQNTIKKYNVKSLPHQTHLFVGIEGIGYNETAKKIKGEKCKSIIDEFNLGRNFDYNSK